MPSHLRAFLRDTEATVDGLLHPAATTLGGVCLFWAFCRYFLSFFFERLRGSWCFWCILWAAGVAGVGGVIITWKLGFGLGLITQALVVRKQKNIVSD